jgi:GH24 family phage-related lysozyme (muramidase)
MPLDLSADEVEQLDQAVHIRYITETEGMFGSALFGLAPKQTQAVAVSLHYQFGTPRRTASPSLAIAWEALREQKYNTAAQALKNRSGWSREHQKFMNRREQEAALLEEIIWQ